MSLIWSVSRLYAWQSRSLAPCHERLLPERTVMAAFLVATVTVVHDGGPTDLRMSGTDSRHTVMGQHRLLAQSRRFMSCRSLFFPNPFAHNRR